ncbi:TonB-dependent receptor [Sphingomicrobium sediminis]|uniref:TonB-dependent receptor n=1 Tax=Sphingomicrobium sediminis TaxID=2950949 RepID=A0A9X2EIG3_9SPHN|nr:TonB-dependent receptor [Sphingomicrobium sediminis]MCM8558142.1 TonB-dependent receptor [Sphingomicrobium sediminis]
MTRTIMLGATVSLAALATPTFAQESATQQPPEADATTATNAEGQDNDEGEIIVTARRNAEALTDVPASISAFNERSLDRLQANDTTGLQGAVPNLNIVQGRGSSNATNIYIRGVGQPDALQTFDPAVGVYVDDVYYSRIRGTQMDLLDLERIEVLRGPQGTLYGKNTIGGAIKLISRRPGDETRGSLQFTLGSYNRFDLKGVFSTPIADNAGIGFAVLTADRDGFVEDVFGNRKFNNKDTFAARGSLAFDPADNVRLDVSVDYARDDAGLTVGQPINPLTDLFGLPLVDGDMMPLVDITPNPDPDDYDFTGRVTPGLPNSTKLKHGGVTGTIGVDLSNTLEFKSITAFRQLITDDYIDIDATELETGDVFVGVDQEQFSQELQLLIDASRVTGVVGLYYLNENVASHQEAYADDLVGPILGNPTFLRTIDDDLNTKSYAAYANFSLAVTDQLNLSAGIRYTNEEKDYFRTTSTFSSSPLLTSAAPFVFEPEDSWDDISPMASIDFSPTPDTLLYARVAKGFKSGGFNGRANNASETRPYDPETVWSYEAGAKASINNQLDIAAAVFHNDYRDFQARVAGLAEDENGLPVPSLAVLNAGELQIRGAELEVVYQPVPLLRLDAQIGYLDAEYKEFDDDRFVDFGGSRAFQEPAFSPDWTMRYGAQYGTEFGDGSVLTFGGQAKYKSRHALAVDNTAFLGTLVQVGTDDEIEGLFQDDFWLFDARVVYEMPQHGLSLGVYGNNLFDQRYKTDGQEFSSVGSIRTVYYGAPRTVDVRVTWRF